MGKAVDLITGKRAVILAVEVIYSHIHVYFGKNGEIEIMDLAIIAAKQVLEMFLMILAGFICFKTGVIKEEGKKKHCLICFLYLVVPAMIV